LLRDDYIGRFRALAGRAHAESCGVLVAAYEPHVGKRIRAVMDLIGGCCRVIHDKRLDQWPQPCFQHGGIFERSILECPG